jgi:hypothetical protein
MCQMCSKVSRKRPEICNGCGDGSFVRVAVTPCDGPQPCDSENHHFGRGDHVRVVQQLRSV